MDRRLFLRTLLERSYDTQEYIKQQLKVRLIDELNTPLTLRRMQMIKMGKAVIKAPQPYTKITVPTSKTTKNRSLTVSVAKRNTIQRQIKVIQKISTQNQQMKGISSNLLQPFSQFYEKNRGHMTPKSGRDKFVLDDLISKKKTQNIQYSRQEGKEGKEEYKNIGQSVEFMNRKHTSESQLVENNSGRKNHRAENFRSAKSIVGYDSDNKSKISHPVKKNYQKQAEDERRLKIISRKEINRNYCKPIQQPPKISAKSYIVCEFGQEISTKIHLTHQSRTSLQIASLTKIMSCILTINICQNYQINMNQHFVTITNFQTAIGGTSAQIKKGQVYTIRQLLYGLMLPSGNDASIALSAQIGKLLMLFDERKKQNKMQINLKTLLQNNKEQFSQILKKPKKSFYNRFIQEMNAKARFIGMSKTVYANPHGLANYNNKSCALDLSLLCEYAMKNQIFCEIVNTKTYSGQIMHQKDQKGQQEGTKIETKSIKPKPEEEDHIFSDEQEQNNQADEDLNEDMTCQTPLNFLNKQEMTNYGTKQITWQNTHKLLHHSNKQYIGIKTGVTNIAGPCLASCVMTADKRKFIIIVLNCKKMSARFKDTQLLRKWVFMREGITQNVKNCTSFTTPLKTLIQQGNDQIVKDEENILR